jgi:hypothetical protein
VEELFAAEPVVPLLADPSPPAAAPVQSSGVRIVGPVESSPIVTREDLDQLKGQGERASDQ